MLPDIQNKIDIDARLMGDIARDIILASIPSEGICLKYDDICQTYGMSLQDMERLLRLPAFNKLLQKEKEKLDSLGPNGGQKYKAEIMSSIIGERILKRMLEDGEETDKMLTFYKTLLQVSGLLDKPEKDKETARSNVAIQINIPQLQNGKLDHLF